MHAESEIINKPGECKLLITRITDAPRELVFMVWTDPEHVAEERDRVISEYGVLEGNTQTLNKMEDYLETIKR